MGEVIRFNGVTCLDIEPDLILKEAVGKLKSVVILGYEENEEERRRTWTETWIARRMVPGQAVKCSYISSIVPLQSSASS